MEFNSIPLFHFVDDFFSKFSSHPLFSTIVALYTLILLYAPSFFLRITLSPVLTSTAIILLFLLRLGAEERLQTHEVDERLEKESNYLESRVVDSIDPHQTHIQFEPKIGLGHQVDETHLEFAPKIDDFDVASYQSHLESKPGSGLKTECNHFEHDLGMESDHHKWESLENNFMESDQVDATRMFLEWNTRTPLEIIYEEYEGEEEEDENDDAPGHKETVGCEKYPSLSMYYPESETDSSSDGDFSMNENWETHESVLFKWEEEEREELIEISLDRYGKTSVEFCHAEEDNLIEIDISFQK